MIHFSNIEKCLFACQFGKVNFFKLSFCGLTSFSSGTAWISVIQSRWFEHVKSKAFIFGIRSDDFAWTEWSHCVVKSVSIKIKRQSIGEGSSWNWDIEILVKFVCLVSGIIHDMSSVRDFTADDHTDASVNIVYSSVGFLY